ncbi:MAG: D-alanyl-D-alanine carboxypeptidase [Chloroflexi bacterium]|nr:D-alanyl-D-alanine carboxypeptidase [Chloroflexota bacterium]
MTRPLATHRLPRWRNVSLLTAVAGLLIAGCTTGATEATEPASFMLPAATADAAVLASDRLVAPLDADLATDAPPPVLYQPGRAIPEPWASAPARRGNAPPPKISATSAIVVDEASMAVLYEHDPHLRRAPASLAKIPTAIIAAERGDLDALVTVDVDASTMRRSTVMGLRPEDEFTLLDLLYGLMLPSGNDAALAIARHLSGSEFAFAEEMTALTKRLGLQDSRFSNPHGLGSRSQYTTAYDLAAMSRYLMTFPVLAEIAGARSWVAEGARTIRMSTYNALLYTYAGADGLKTGYTRSAGKTYAGSATRDGHRIYVVLLDAPNREEDARRLLDWAFEAYSWPAPVVAR